MFAVQVTAVQLNSAAQAHWGVLHAFQHRIRLITGKTHQIRAQLAAVASPLLGDHLYATLLAHGVFHQVPPPGKHDCVVLDADQSRTGSQPACSGAQELREPRAWIDEYREAVAQDCPLGLQAHQLQVDHTSCMGDPPVTFSAGAPWWL